jgi:hypothetical protein
LALKKFVDGFMAKMLAFSIHEFVESNIPFRLTDIRSVWHFGTPERTGKRFRQDWFVLTCLYWPCLNRPD